MSSEDLNSYGRRMAQVTEFLADRGCVNSYYSFQFQQQTGHSWQIFKDIWMNYCGNHTPIKRPEQLFNLFVFYKSYPPVHCTTLFSQKANSKDDYKSGTRLYDKISTYQKYLASVIDELHFVWNRRLQPENSLPDTFDTNVTGCLDVFPIVVNRPKDAEMQAMLYNGKYKKHVLKVGSKIFRCSVFSESSNALFRNIGSDIRCVLLISLTNLRV